MPHFYTEPKITVLARPQFVQWHTQWEGKAWDTTIARQGQEKLELPGDCVRLPVMSTPTISVARSRELLSSIVTCRSVEYRTEAEDAMRQVASVGTGSAIVSGQLFGELGTPLRPGVASNSNAGQFILGVQLRPPQSELLMPTGVFEGPFAKKRQLSAKASDPDAMRVSKNSRKCHKLHPAFVGVTGNLLACRKRGLEVSSTINEQFCKGGGNIVESAKASYRKASKAPPQEVHNLIDEYDTLVSNAKVMSGAIKDWSIGDCEVNCASLVSICEQLEQVSADLTDNVEQMKGEHEALRLQASRDHLREVKLRKQSVAKYRETVPEVLL